MKRSTEMQKQIDDSEEMIYSKDPNGYFYFDEEYGIWLRILSRRGNEFLKEISVPLEPVEGMFDWDDLKYILIHINEKERNPFNFVNYLPIEVFEKLSKNTNVETASLTIHSDIVAHIDLEELLHRGGYNPLKTVCMSSQSYLPIDWRIRNHEGYWFIDPVHESIIRLKEISNLRKGIAK